jgi:hypothetical protein
VKTVAQSQQEHVLKMLVDGASMRPASRVTGVARTTISALFKNVGAHAP